MHRKIRASSSLTFHQYILIESKCACCTFCQLACGCVGEETEDETVLRAIGFSNSDEIKQAETFRHELVLEEQLFFQGQQGGEEDNGESDEVGENSESEEED